MRFIVFGSVLMATAIGPVLADDIGDLKLRDWQRKSMLVNTHFGNNAEDLASVAEKLDRYPNMYVDSDARISELGRQPYTARKFFHPIPCSPL